MAKDSGMSSLLTLGVGIGGLYFLYEWLTAPTTAAVSAPASTAAPVSTSVTTGGAAVVPAGPSLASLYSNILAGASTDPNFTGAGDSLASTPYRWATYLNIALAGKASPDLSSVFSGVDLTQPMSASTFWASMGPALTKEYGLSGLMAGLGAFASARGLGDAFSDAFSQASGGVDVNVDAATNPAFGGSYPIGPLVQDSLTVTPSTAGTGYNINPTTGAVTVASSGMSTSTWLLIGGSALVVLLLATGKR